jgi:hypothetical protein
MQRWRGKRITFREKTTQYWSDISPTTRNLAVYSDRPSKVTGTPCCHVEHRRCFADACRRRELGTFQELLDLDYHAFWKRELYLKAIDPAKLERAIDRRARDAMRGNPPPLFVQNLEVGPGQTRRQALRDKISADVARLLNVPPSHLHMVKAQDLKDVAAWLADKCLVMVPNDHFLMMLNRYDSVVDSHHHHVKP